MMWYLTDYRTIPSTFEKIIPDLLDLSAALNQKFINSTNFQQAWEHVAENQGCAGVDGETISHFSQRSEVYLAELIEALSMQNYHPMPLRQLFVPKKQGGWRTIAVPSVRDCIVQQALLQVLHPVLEPQFEPCSFAYRPGRSHLMAIRQVAHWRDRGYDWVLDADIVQYFDNLQHPRLLAEMKERLDQPEFLALIQNWLSVGVLTKAGIVFPERGIPQGAVISPILANVYLDDFDEILTAAGLKLVRYADGTPVQA